MDEEYKPIKLFVQKDNMPETCAECCLNYDTVWCIVTGTSFHPFDKSKWIDDEKERLPDCPLWVLEDVIERTVKEIERGRCE